MRTIRGLTDLPAGARVVVFGFGRQGRNLSRALAVGHTSLSLVAVVDDAVTLPGHTPPVLPPQEANDVLAAATHILVPGTLLGFALTRLPETVHDKIVVLDEALNYAFVFAEAERDRVIQKAELVAPLLPARDAEVFRHLVTARIAGTYYYEDKHPRHSLRKYPFQGMLYLDYMTRDAIAVVIDGGVANGGVEREMLRHLPAVRRMVGFDPVPELYQRSPHREALESGGVFEFVPQGLWREPCQMKVHLNGDGSYVTGVDREPAAQTVDLTSIDTFVAQHVLETVDLIKLDVEGSELQALEGGMASIRRFRPVLAVCMYHDREDLFDIPLYLARELADYTFRIGHYSTTFIDTVLYAIPRERVT